MHKNMACQIYRRFLQWMIFSSFGWLALFGVFLFVSAFFRSNIQDNSSSVAERKINERSMTKDEWKMKKREERKNRRSDVRDGSDPKVGKLDKCVKCGHSEYEYDKSWKEYSCKNCGWIIEKDNTENGR